MKFLSTNQVVEQTGLSRVTIWRYERAENFPKRVQLGPNRIAYRSDEVEDWIDSRPRVDVQESNPTDFGSCEA